MRLPYRVVMLLLVVPLKAFADSATDEVDTYIPRQMELHHVPGISVGILKDGKVLLAKGYGLAMSCFSRNGTARPAG